MRFLTDIPFGKAVRDHLQAQGHDVLGVAEYLSAQATDPEIVAAAISMNRTILCFDLGFGGLVALSKKSVPSIVTFRTARLSSKFIIPMLDEILPLIESDLIRGALVAVEDHRIRIRHLPV